MDRDHLRQSGGFGSLLHLAHNRADFEATKKSYERYARHVAPGVSGANRNREASLGFAGEHGREFMTDAMAAAAAMIHKRAAEEAEKRSRS